MEAMDFCKELEKLWTKDQERLFFKQTIEKVNRDINKLAYKMEDNKYYAYWPKDYSGKRTTLQSRNSHIGAFTERFVKNLLDCFIKRKQLEHLYAINNVVCKELGLSEKSSADVALCKTPDRIQRPENIIMIFEVKMSIVWNWELRQENNSIKVTFVGDEHQGVPGLLRSDSVLKAIGKAVNIRFSGPMAAGIPIIVIGNTPISKSYYKKVDKLRKAGVIQGLWSINPYKGIRSSPNKGFITFPDSNALYSELLKFINKSSAKFFSGRKSLERLGSLIEKASKKCKLEAKALEFLELLEKDDET